MGLWQWARDFHFLCLHFYNYKIEIIVFILSTHQAFMRLKIQDNSLSVTNRSVTILMSIKTVKLLQWGPYVPHTEAGANGKQATPLYLSTTIFCTVEVAPWISSFSVKFLHREECWPCISTDVCVKPLFMYPSYFSCLNNHFSSTNHTEHLLQKGHCRVKIISEMC